MKKIISFILALCIMCSLFTIVAFACEDCIDDSFAYHGRGQVNKWDGIKLWNCHDYSHGYAEISTGTPAVIAGTNYVTLLYMHQYSYVDSSGTTQWVTWYQVRGKSYNGTYYVGWTEAKYIDIVPGYEDMSLDDNHMS